MSPWRHSGLEEGVDFSTEPNTGDKSPYSDWSPFRDYT